MGEFSSVGIVAFKPCDHETSCGLWRRLVFNPTECDDRGWVHPSGTDAKACCHARPLAEELREPVASVLLDIKMHFRRIGLSKQALPLLCSKDLWLGSHQTSSTLWQLALGLLVLGPFEIKSTGRPPKQHPLVRELAQDQEPESRNAKTAWIDPAARSSLPERKAWENPPKKLQLRAETTGSWASGCGDFGSRAAAIAPDHQYANQSLLRDLYLSSRSSRIRTTSSSSCSRRRRSSSSSSSSSSRRRRRSSSSSRRTTTTTTTTATIATIAAEKKSKTVPKL